MFLGSVFMRLVLDGGGLRLAVINNAALATPSKKPRHIAAAGFEGF
jgi:hypothetical protein